MFSYIFLGLPSASFTRDKTCLDSITKWLIVLIGNWFKSQNIDSSLSLVTLRIKYPKEHIIGNNRSDRNGLVEFASERDRERDRERGVIISIYLRIIMYWTIRNGRVEKTTHFVYNLCGPTRQTAGNPSLFLACLLCWNNGGNLQWSYNNDIRKMWDILKFVLY